MAQIKFTASITPAQINKDEYAQLKFSVENAKDVQDIRPPMLNDFDIVSGPNQESGMSMINGDVKKYVAVNFIIRPKKPGNFTIPPGIAFADGTSYRSNPVIITVNNRVAVNQPGTNRPSSPFSFIEPFEESVSESLYEDYILRKGENADDKIRKNIFIKVETDKNSCFVGEPVIANYKLYTRLKSESSMIKNPSFNGFSVIDLQLPDNMSYKRERLNGRDYNVYTIRKVQLYPLQPGNLQLETAEIENTVHFIREAYANRQQGLAGDIFRDFADAGIPQAGMEEHRIILQSKPLNILVKPLPVNEPAGFKGAVGLFSIEAILEKNKFSTDDAGKLTLVISGEGNLQMVTAPVISWPGGIEGFEPRITEDIFKTTVPVSGRKIIDYAFTVYSAGTYVLPAVEFSFFDPKENRYKSVVSKTLDFTVTKGTGKSKPVVNTKNNKGDESVLNRFFGNRLQVAGVVAVMILIGLILWLKSDHKKVKLARAVQDSELNKAKVENTTEARAWNLENPLAAAEEHLLQNDNEAFYNALNQSLKNYLSNKLDIKVMELNKKTIIEMLDKKGVSNSSGLQWIALLDEIEWQLYTPIETNTKMQEFYERAYLLIQQLNRFDFKHQ